MILSCTRCISRFVLLSFQSLPPPPPLQARREDLSSALASEALLTEEEEAQLRRVEDALDSIEAELEFLTGERDECTRQIRAATQAEAALGERARDLSKAEASTILSKYIEALAHNREVERQQTDKICELEVRLAEADKVLEEARMQAKRVEIDADRRITEVQRQSERKLMHVMGQVEVVARGSRAGALGGSQADGAGDMSARAMNSARSLAQGQAGAQSIEGTFDGLPVGDLQRLVAFYKEQAELLQVRRTQQVERLPLLTPLQRLSTPLFSNEHRIHPGYLLPPAA